MSEITEKQEPGEVTVQAKAIIDDKCARCVKKERYKAIELKEETPPAELLVVHERPMCVMVTEVGNNVEKYLLFYKCQDVWCLLNHLREGLMSSWLMNLKKAQEREYDQLRFDAMKNHKKRGRRGNRRERAREKERGRKKEVEERNGL